MIFLVKLETTNSSPLYINQQHDILMQVFVVEGQQVGAIQPIQFGH